MTPATFVGRNEIMSTARPELPYPCNSLVKSRVKTSLRGKLCDDVVSSVKYICVKYKMYYVYHAITHLTICDRNKGSLYN